MIRSIIQKTEGTEARISLRRRRKATVSWVRFVIPKIVAVLTGHGRHQVETEFQPNAWVHNLFRVWEAVAWRRNGRNGAGDTIRAESVAVFTRVDGVETVSYRFYTVEAFLTQAEGLLRAAISKRIPKLVFVPVPAYAFAGIGVAPSPGWMKYLNFAIAYEASGRQTAANASTCTVNLAAAGSNRISIMAAQADNGFGQTAFVSITVGGSSTGVTQIETEIAPSATRHNRIYYLIAPPSASTAYVLNSDQLSVQQDSTFVVANYSGAAQSSQPDSSNKTTSTTGTFTLSTTVVLANSWLVSTGTGTSPGNLSAGTGTTERSAGSGAFKYGDSNGAVAAGSRSMQWVDSGSATNGGIIASIAPGSQTFNQSVDASASISASMLVPKTIVSALTATVSNTATVAIIKDFVRTLTATATNTASVLKGLTLAVTATTTVTATIEASRAFIQALTATVGATASLVKSTTFARTLSAATTATATLTKQLALNIALTAGATITTTIDLVREITMTATTTVAASITTAIHKSLVASVTIIAKVSAPFWRTKYPAHGDGDDYEIKYPHD